MRSLVIALAIGAGAGACGTGGEKAIPRREAYPRPQLPDTVMVAAGAPLRWLVSHEAVVSRDEQPGWVTVDYPKQRARAYVTFSQPDSMATAIENRLTRMGLNAGDRPVEATTWENAAGYSIQLVNQEQTVTPLQFLAVNPTEGWLVSGSVHFSDPGAATAEPDSMRPVVEALKSQVVIALDSLR